MLKKNKRFLAAVMAMAILSAMYVPPASAAGSGLENGSYYFYSINGEYGLNDLFNAGDGGKVGIDKLDGEGNEIWVVTNTVDGYITISPYSQPGVYLSGENGFDRQLVLRRVIPSGAQYQWKAIRVDQGYVLKNRANGYVIDCANGQNRTAGNPYLLYERNGCADAQTIIPVRLSISTTALTPANRVTDLATAAYKVTLFNDKDQALNSQFGTKNGAMVVCDPYNGEQNEIIKIVARGNGLYSLHFAANESLCIVPSDIYIEAQMTVKPYTGAKNCLYEIYKVGDSYCFRNAATGLMVDDFCCCTATGTKIIQYTYNGTNAQQFYLTRVDGGSTGSGSAVVSSAWQMPMKNAYCTWRSYSNMSWGSYTKNASGRNYHLGIDIYGTNGTVYAAAAGKVVAASSGTSGANGRYIILEHTLDGKRVYSFYAHLSSLNVSVGQTVSAGTQIAKAGGSGYGRNQYYGTHLHFAVVDTLWTSGGYYGYATAFSGSKVTYRGVTYYDPVYVVNHNKLP